MNLYQLHRYIKMLPQSYFLLSATRRSIKRSANVILRSFSDSIKAAPCSTRKIPEIKSTNSVTEHNSSESVTPNSVGYINQALPVNQTNAHNYDVNNIVAANSSQSEQIQNITFLENDVNKLDTSDAFNEELPGPLDVCTEDMSDVGPYWQPTYTFAKYANQSKTIQQLAKLGVEIYRFESNTNIMEKLLSLDFDRDIKPYIQFLHDCGVAPHNLGSFITKNPKILEQDLDNLHTRIRYLRAHGFSVKMIEEIINKNPLWLSNSTKHIDDRLGHFQHTFKLRGYEVRQLTVKCPRLITYEMRHIRENTFAVKEEMGFNHDETKLVLLNAPRVWISSRKKVVNSFDYAHNQMKLSHEIISKQPLILLCRQKRLEHRHKFLEELKKVQYDPTKPMYVSPMNIIFGTDVYFCTNVAKTSIETYNMFLKTF